jgi:integrase
MRSTFSLLDVLTCLSTVLKTACEWGVLDRLPCRVKLLKVPKPSVEFYEPEIYEMLVAAAEKVGPSVHRAILLGGDGGLRLGEIIALEWADIDLARRQLHVQRSDWRGEIGLPKSGKPRIVPMTERLAAVLRKGRGVGRARVICLDDGSALDRDRLKRQIAEVQGVAGIEDDGRVHILRHTFGARLAMAGAPAKAIQELMGHADLTTTQRYMHHTPQATQEAIRRLDVQARGDVGETKEPPAQDAS